MKKKLGLLIVLLAFVFAGCSSDAGKQASDVYGVDDLAGKKIGVQIGTVGDTYASDYEGD